jgi:1-pyrroline-5-carboxylate dehydrogenase
MPQMENLIAPTSPLPRVTYTNYKTDFTPVIDFFDDALPIFRKHNLGKTHLNIINGSANEDGKLYPSHSPIDSNIKLGDFVAASPNAVDAAIKSAKNAFTQWGKLHWRERVQMLRRVAREMDEGKYTLAMASIYEVGKIRLEAMGEAEEIADFINYFCDMMEEHNGYSPAMRPAWPNESATLHAKPYGVFAVVAPFNFPLAMPSNMIFPALLAGNTIVFKPSPNSGLTASLFVDVMHKAGLPPGVVNLLCGGDETGIALTSHPEIDGVAFTGSYNVGMKLHAQMASGKYPRPCVVEMGGKNPSYVSADAYLDQASDGIVRSSFGMSGQKCSANSKVYVDHRIYDQFLGIIKEKTAKLVLDNPENPGASLGPVIDERAADRFVKAAAMAAKDGAVIIGGERSSASHLSRGFYCQPTIVAGLERDHFINKTELFCPILSVIKYENLAEAITDGNSVEYGLTAGFYSQNQSEIELFTSSAEAGVLYINRASGATTGTWPGVQSFCGWKGSGTTGRGGMGPHYIMNFLREQSQTRWFGQS